MLTNYRTRIYNSYISSQRNSISPPGRIEDFKPRLPYLKHLIYLHFPKDKNSYILDLGCGNGLLVYLARQMGFINTSGIDISSEQIKLAKSLNIEGVKQGDIIQALYNTNFNSIDCLITFDVIEHFNRNEIISFVDRALKALKPNGRWIIHTPNAESPFGMRMRYWDLTHEMAFTHTSISQLLLSSGFSRVTCYEDQPIPHGIKSFIRFFLWKVIRFCLQSYIAVETGEIDRKNLFSQNFLTVAYK